MNKTWRKHGFTLIELMVVIAIIGVLASFAMPRYQSYIAKARLTNVLSVSHAYMKDKALHYGQTASWGTRADLDKDEAQLKASFDFASAADLHTMRDQYIVTANAPSNRLLLAYRLTDIPGVDGRVDMKFSLWPNSSSTANMRFKCYVHKQASSTLSQASMPEGCTLSNF